MKKIKKMLCLGLVLAMSLNISASAFAVKKDNPYNKDNQDGYSYSSTNSVNWLNLIGKAVWYVAKAADTSFYQRAGATDKSCGWVRKSTGTIQFNSSNVGSSVKLTVPLGKKNLAFDAFATTNITNWADTISVIVTDLKGNDVIDNSVTNNQHSFYDSTTPYGNYLVRFIENGSSKWNCFVSVTDWDVKCNSKTAKQITGDNTVKEYINDEKNKKSYFVPSANHKNRNIKLSNQPLNIKELSDQFFDDQLGVYVNSAKNYNIGDNIVFTDTIKNVFYNPKVNATYFEFKCGDETISWPFLGDLTEQYHSGDKLKLNFKLVKEYSDAKHIFENIDYFQDGYNALQRGTYLNINDYLL